MLSVAFPLMVGREGLEPSTIGLIKAVASGSPRFAVPCLPDILPQ